jgi:hypothetical protein
LFRPERPQNKYAGSIHPEHWRSRAEEVRTLAEDMTDQQARESLLRIVQEYERLAERAEKGSRPAEQA